MIISASRRTDIPSYYSEWFFNRLRAGYVYVRNPMNPHRISEVSLSPDVVDGIVFWTKNPTPMLDRLPELRDYAYYFQFTLTPYGTDVEKNLPSKTEAIIPGFQKLSSLVGKERVVWRYDPILINGKYTVEYHKTNFSALCHKLADHTGKCTVSFLDVYRNIQRGIAHLNIRPPDRGEAEELAGYFVETARDHGIYIDTCAESLDLGKFGIGHASCIDRHRLERIGGCRLDIERDKNQREACGCVSSIDLGAYNTCRNNCVYCYANFNQTLVNDCCGKHKPDSPLLYGEVTDVDVVKPREVRSFRDGQMHLFG
ncbi:MAG: DUF1848 domain-containing protein [Clostridia bacterium]|nr:DUF1848 domain-containing protein [Clostridia bacterium]